LPSSKAALHAGCRLADPMAMAKPMMLCYGICGEDASDHMCRQDFI